MPDLSDKVSDKVSELCPFCGSVPVVESHPVHEGWSQTGRRIVCRNKDCFGPATGWYDDDEAMFAAWNRRTRPAASIKEGWQTMDSAPKSDQASASEPTRILLRFGDEAVSIAYWDWYYAEGGRGYRTGFAWVEPCSGETLDLHYTTAPDGWMHVPAAPIPPEVSKP